MKTKRIRLFLFLFYFCHSYAAANPQTTMQLKCSWNDEEKEICLLVESVEAQLQSIEVIYQFGHQAKKNLTSMNSIIMDGQKQFMLRFDETEFEKADIAKFTFQAFSKSGKLEKMIEGLSLFKTQIDSMLFDSAKNTLKSYPATFKHDGKSSLYTTVEINDRIEMATSNTIVKQWDPPNYWWFRDAYKTSDINVIDFSTVKELSPMEIQVKRNWERRYGLRVAVFYWPGIVHSACLYANRKNYPVQQNAFSTQWYWIPGTIGLVRGGLEAYFYYIKKYEKLSNPWIDRLDVLIGGGLLYLMVHDLCSNEPRRFDGFGTISFSDEQAPVIWIPPDPPVLGGNSTVFLPLQFNFSF